MKYFILLSIAVLLCSNAYSQGYSKYWVFGDSTGIIFEDDGSISSYNSKSRSLEPSASISDYSGTLQFYTNGQNIWNREDEIMVNGTDLEIGQIIVLAEDFGSSITQGVLIIPFPENNNKYYIFYIAYEYYPLEKLGIRYAVVDMSLDSGLGEVIEKNIPIYDSITTEKLQAVKHANGRDWWLLAQQSTSTSAFEDVSFIRFLITPEGIEGPYFQHYGPEAELTASTFGYFGEMIFSQQGDKLAYTAGTNLDIYDFDRCSGELSKVKTIFNVDNQFTYGCAFSPDGKKIYVSGFDNKTLYQFSLISDENIDSTKQAIYNISGSLWLGQLEIGLNNKVYFTIANYEDKFSSYNKYLNVINNPNGTGIACEIETHLIYLNGKRTFGGLPNMPNYNLGALAGSGCDTLTNVMQIKESNNIQIYPNPAYEYIIISGDIKANYILKIYSADGRVVLQEKINTTNSRVDISKLPPGVYVIQISEYGWVKYSEKLFK